MEQSTETPTLVEFLRARLDEDEGAARAANEGPWKIARSRRAEDDEMAILSGESEIVGAGYEGGGVWAKEDAEHIARHDPDRELREVDAKRKIIDEHVIVIDGVAEGEVLASSPTEPSHSPRFGCWVCHMDDRQIYDGGYCFTLRALTLPYADHPDYREEWRP